MLSAAALSLVFLPKTFCFIHGLGLCRWPFGLALGTLALLLNKVLSVVVNGYILKVCLYEARKSRTRAR